MSEGSYLHEIHNLTVIGFADEVLEHLRKSNLQGALKAMEQAVCACESHPSYAVLATSECKTIARLIDMTMQLVTAEGAASQRAQALLDRMHALHRTTFN